jgi:hypothetical protein
MKLALLKLALVFSIITTLSAFAADQEQHCDDNVINIIGKFLKINDVFLHKKSSDSGVIVAAACKPSPANKNIILTSIAYTLFDEKHPEKEFDKELIVAMVNIKTKRVVSSYQYSIGEDALTEVGASSLKIDTARYQLNKNTRAFGLIFNSVAHGANCGENYWADELTLFVQKGKNLEPVLWDLPMQFTHFKKGCPAIFNDKDVDIEYSFLTIDVQKTSNNGYSDLLLTAHINDSGERDLKPKLTDERCLLTYDGKRYVKNKKFKSWWMLDSW